MIGSKEFLRLVAFAKFVYVDQVLLPVVPIRTRFIGKILTTIATGVKGGDDVYGRLRLRMARAIIGRWNGCGRIEDIFEVAIKGRAGPGMATKV